MMSMPEIDEYCCVMHPEAWERLKPVYERMRLSRWRYLWRIYYWVEATLEEIYVNLCAYWRAIRRFVGKLRG